MTGLAIAPTAIMEESAASARTGVVPAIIGPLCAASARTGVLPAIIGALGAAIALNAFAPLFATASIPISVLGVVLGLRSHRFEAAAAGCLAIVCAMAALLNSEIFWIAFGVVGSAVTAG